MRKTLEDCSGSRSLENKTYSAVTNSSHPKMEGDDSENSDHHVTESSPIEKDLKSEEIEWISNNDSHIDDNITSRIKKSRSLGSGLNLKGKVSGGSDAHDETDQIYSSNGSGSHSDLVVPGSSKDLDIFMPNQSQEAVPSDSFQESPEVVNIDTIFSISDPQHSEKKVQDTHDLQFSGAGEYSDHTPRTRIIVKSSSLPTMHSPVRHFTCYLHRSRSAEDLSVLDSRCKEMSTYEIGTQVTPHEERDNSALNNGKSNSEHVTDYCSDVNNYDGLAKDWIMPVVENINSSNHREKESSFYSWNELPSGIFKNKRLEEWVKDLQHYSPSDETSGPSFSNDEVPEEGTLLDVSPAARVDGKVNPSMDAGKKYISSLNATSTSAQLKNHGLVVMPFLSAFTSLRELNLSGNAIVRITAGTLPRGLHVLNLSKNVSTIEGLRELARLRILDLSYNRILRIGHGLASCASLKELYLAGNKISEVEGVHRLLKLIILDLRFNKISTAKCLGQLAANYNSLQAVSLEGNPAQKNIGDEQLKKHLLGLLPHLAYYNGKPIKVVTLKDAADRATRLGINSHQSGRNLRAELKMSRKGTQGVATNTTSSSSVHARKSQDTGSSKASRGRSGHLPPTGTKTSTARHHLHDFSNKLLNSKLHLSIRRSRSEGTLGVLA